MRVREREARYFLFDFICFLWNVWYLIFSLIIVDFPLLNCDSFLNRVNDLRVHTKLFDYYISLENSMINVHYNDKDNLEYV